MFITYIINIDRSKMSLSFANNNIDSLLKEHIRVRLRVVQEENEKLMKLFGRALLDKELPKWERDVVRAIGMYNSTTSCYIFQTDLLS